MHIRNSMVNSTAIDIHLRMLMVDSTIIITDPSLGILTVSPVIMFLPRHLKGRQRLPRYRGGLSV
jgi:hypothetical protein